jgi:hypothetical protein
VCVHVCVTAIYFNILYLCTINVRAIEPVDLTHMWPTTYSQFRHYYSKLVAISKTCMTALNGQKINDDML